MTDKKGSKATPVLICTRHLVRGKGRCLRENRGTDSWDWAHLQ